MEQFVIFGGFSWYCTILLRFA